MTRLFDLFLDPIRMIRDIRTELPRALDVWGAALNFPQLAGGLYFIGTLEGSLVLGSWLLVMLTAGYIHRHQRFSRLIGLCQVWWLPVLPALIQGAVGQTEISVFSVWLWYVCVTMVISLVLDVYDIHRYVSAADRTYRKR